MNKPVTEKIDWFLVKSKLEMEPMIKHWLAFNKMSSQAQQMVWEEWNECLKACRESAIGKLCRDMADAIKRNDLPALDGLRQLRKDLVAMGNEIKKPKLFPVDPMAFYHDQQVYQYKKACEEIERGRTKVNF